MQRKVERGLVAKVGTLVFAVVLGLPATLSPLSARASVIVASAVEDAFIPAAVASAILVDDLGAGSAPAWDATHAPIAAPPRPAPTAPAPEPLVHDGMVIASWYGPGFYGNRTACGQTYTPEILGVAHRLLPCGTRLRITSPTGATVVVAVIDRGPYVVGRALDLSSATRDALSCGDLCHVRMTVID